jgi:hypothetical protein
LDVLAVLFELALGVGLTVARRAHAGLWLVTVAAFVGFLGYNLHGLLVGQTSCGCFGAVTVRPGQALALDAAVLVLLSVWAAVDPGARLGASTVRQAGSFLAGYAAAAALWLLPAHLLFGSVEAAAAAVRGDAVFVEPAVLDFGAQPAGTAAEATLTVRATRRQPVRLVGGTSNCSCTLLPDLPAAVPAGGSCRLRVRLTVPRGTGAYQVRAVLWTDSETNDVLPVAIRGRSVGP